MCVHASVLFCVNECLSLCVSAAWAYWVPVTTRVESDWLQQWLHSLWPRLQAPGSRAQGNGETVNKPQLAASLGITQQPGCPDFFFFFLADMRDLGWEQGLGRERSWMGVSVFVWLCGRSQTDLQEVVQVVLWSQGAHRSPFPGAHLLNQHLDLVQLQDAFGPCQVLEVLPESNQTWKHKQTESV